MDSLYSPVKDIACCLWNCVSERVVYIRELPENLNSLEDAMTDLRNVYEDVRETVLSEEKLHRKRTNEVDRWMESVVAMQERGNDLLAQGRAEVQKKCLGTCCPKNCCASYKIGKKVPAMINEMNAKRTERQNIHELTQPLPPPPVIERPLDEMVGVDSIFNHVCMQLQDEKVTRVGLYGVGGVGKTTLLNRINNEFLKTKVGLDAAIWVTVSRPANVQKIQRVLFNKLHISNEKWEDRSEDERKEEIFNVLKTKNFVLLWDDVWEPLDLLSVGIPPLRDGSKSKVVLTTRDLSVCQYMGAEGIEVKKLPWEDAFALFLKYGGEDTIRSHPHILKLAKSVAKQCDGLPLALTVIGRAMGTAKTPEEWENKIQMLKKYPEKFPGMKNDLFLRLAFSYDNLQDEATKSCFLYCSLFPEDHQIDYDRLIQLWTGEGFLDKYKSIKEAKNGGGEIIASLCHACLLEEGIFSGSSFFEERRYVKMHDVIRDMALWLTSQDRNEEQNKFVVVDKGESVSSQQLEGWEEAERMSLFDIGFEQQTVSSPSFSKLQTLMLCGADRETVPFSFPNGFFNRMPVITVLDLRYLQTLVDLPKEIGNLSTLRYLNLTQTRIKEIPKELGNLKNLRYLILDYMRDLEKFPPNIISRLSSLRLFSFICFIHMHIDRKAWRQELEGLNYIEEIFINLSCVLSIQTLVNSQKLGGCLRFLQVDGYLNINILDLVTTHLEKLEVTDCTSVEAVGVHSTLPRNQSLSQLSEVVIYNYMNLKTLTCLAHAPNLKILSVSACKSLEEVIRVEECGTSSEINLDQLDIFSRLRRLYLFDLENLRSICTQNLQFPSLKVMFVDGCLNLRKLPFDSNITRSKQLEQIVVKEEWWNALDWEDDTIKDFLTPYLVH